MALDVGPLPGNGSILHVDDSIALGFCEVSNGEIGNYISGQFNIGQGWVENAVLCLLDGCQSIIDAPVASGGFGGNIGLFWKARVLDSANRWSKDLIAINAHPALVNATDKYDPDKKNMGTICFEFAEGFIDASGHPQWRVKNYTP